MSTKTVLVTGAAGWIGSRVTSLAASRGHRVWALVRPGTVHAQPQADGYPITWVEADLDRQSMLVSRLRDDPPDICVHCAWYTKPKDYLQAAENLQSVRSSLNLLAALRESGCRRFVGLGTCFEYAFEGVTAPLPETAELASHPLYAACKQAVRMIAEQLIADSAWVRLFHLYGPGEARGRLVPHLLETLLAGQQCPLTAGTQVRDYLHVDDAAAAIVSVALSETRGPVNIGSGTAVSVADLARTVGQLLGAADLLRLGAIEPRRDDPAFVVADVRRLAAITGWQRRFDLRSGLRDMIDAWPARLTP